MTLRDTLGRCERNRSPGRGCYAHLVDAPDPDFAAPLPAAYAHLDEWQQLLVLGIDAELLSASLRMTVEERLRGLAASDAVFCALHGVALHG